jgi:8-oxo-dGTP pyrophosphatase MutT (NUDIX family)
VLTINQPQVEMRNININELYSTSVEYYSQKLNIEYTRNFNYWSYKNLLTNPNTSDEAIDVVGAAIFDPYFTQILLVKGRGTGKWSPPKGHIEQGENHWETLCREIREEIGLQIDTPTPLLPSIYCKRGKLYGLILSPEIPLITHDQNEIEDIRWFNLVELEKLVASQPQTMNAFIRCLFRPTTNPYFRIKLDIIKSALLNYNIQKNFSQPAYPSMLPGIMILKINQEVTELINTLKNEHIQYDNYYIMLNLLKSKYNLKLSDLIYFIRIQS